MAPSDPDNYVARLMTLGSVGTEMAAPIAVGALVDWWLGLMPILTIIGAVLGLVGGTYHLIQLNKPKP